jgi:putative tricarboxylic transport membrane protein
MVLAFIAVTSVLGKSRVRGFASLLIGLTIGLVGLDPQSGQSRLTFGSLQLADGIDIVIVAVGLFAVGESLWIASRLRHDQDSPIPVGRPWLSRADLRRTWKPWLRGPLIGFPFGAIPAGGAEIPTFLSYVAEKKLSKHPDEWGAGAIEGVAGPESTASASASGTLVTMLSLGLPTTATAAVMLAAFQQYGIQPGPLLFERESGLVWGLIASLFVGTLLLLVLNLPLAPVWAKLLKVPRPYLYAGILFFASVGAYAVSGQVTDLIVLFVIGVLGFAMRRYGLPILPAIIGVILGPAAELQMRRALQISDGSLTGLVNTAFSVTVYVIVLLILLWPLIRRVTRKPPAPARKEEEPVG